MKRRIAWWCPECKAPVLQRGPCPKCRHEQVASWRCDNTECHTIVVNRIRCPNCNRTRATTIYNGLLVNRLFQETSKSGHTNIDIMRRFAYKYVKDKRMPHYIAEEGVSQALEKLVENIKSYDSAKGKFLTWAITILKNEINRAAAVDATEHGITSIYLDSVGPDGQLAMEAVLGYTYGVDDLIAMEDRQKYRLMAKLARQSFGLYSTVADGQPVNLSVYELCIQTYMDRDGMGWLAAAARVAGISRQVLSFRKIRAKEKWQEWKGVEER